MDFGGVDQKGNPTIRKAPPPSTPPPTKKKIDPAEEKRRTEAQEKEKQEGIEMAREKFRLQAEINLSQRKLKSIEKEQAKRSGQSGSKRVVVTEEQILQQGPTSAHSSPRSAETSSKKLIKEKEKRCQFLVNL